MEALAASEIDTTLFFYNPNIHPIEEYEIRKEENIRFAKKLGMPVIDADYDRDEWFERTKGQENEIGRASCRERVQISVVAVSLKKKNKHRRGRPNMTTNKP